MPSAIRSALLVGLLMGWTTAAAGQETASSMLVTVGSSVLHADRVRERTDTMLVYVSEGGRTANAIDVLRTLLRTEPTSRIVRYEEVKDGLGETVDAQSFALDRRTLAPIEILSWSQGEKRQLHVDHTRIYGTVQAGDSSTVIDFSVPHMAFYSNSMDVLLVALQLTPGDSARVEILDVDGESTQVIRVRAGEEEPIKTGDGGICRARSFSVQSGPSQGTYWIGRDGGLVQYEAPSSNLRMLRIRTCSRIGQRGGLERGQ